MEKQPILLFSGGLDSFIAYHYLKAQNMDILPMYINYNGKYCNKEQSIVTTLIGKTELRTREFNLRAHESGDNAFIPFRNLYLATYAATFSNNIFLAGLKDDNVGDKSQLFFGRLSRTLSEAKGEEVNICSPFWRKEKADIIGWYIQKYGKVKAVTDLSKTTSCYHPEEKYCGTCPSCYRKFCALGYNGINLNYHNMDLAKKYLKRANAGEFTDTRNLSIIVASKKLGLIP